MIGLLPALSRASLLSPRPVPRATPEDEAMAARFLAEQRAGAMRGLIPAPAQSAPAAPDMGMGGLLSQVQALPARQAPMQRERGRVNPARVLSRFILGGEDPFQAADAERERLQAEADRPRILAEQNRLRGLAAQYGPLGELAWAGNQEEAGKAFASNLEGYSLSAGGIRGGVNGVVAGAPTTTTVNDSIYQNDPVARTSTLIATAAPGYDDLTQRQNADTARFNAENPVLAANSTWVGPDGQPRAQGYIAPEVTNLAAGGEALITDAQGNVVNRYASNSVRPMSDADQAAVQRADSFITASQTAVGRAQQIAQQIQSGQLNLGPMTNAISEGRNRFGRSDQNSLNYDALMSWAKEARDAILAANTGVQTDGDAVRALDRILSSSGDERVVQQSLARFIEAQNASQQVFQRDIDRRSGGQANNAQGGAPVVSQQQYQSLPSGARFIAQGDPSQTVRIKP